LGVGRAKSAFRSKVTLTAASATFASRNGVPLELISKVLLRHQNLKTTQLYLGKVSDSEAIRWMDILYGK
jgi:integrase/recombinase XerD